jgi:glycosyltransferase involved in cell wall biosynthesis
LPPNVPVLGYLGALFPEDAALLVDAFACVRAMRRNVVLILIGNSKAKVPDRDGLIRAGFVSQPDLNLYLAACDVLCLPLVDSVANRGRYPSKLGDYFCAARPTVACAVGDVASVLQTAQAGLLAEPNVTGFAEQILVLLGDSHLRDRLGRNARLAVDTYYNWSTMSEQVESFYKRVLDTTMKKTL